MRLGSKRFDAKAVGRVNIVNATLLARFSRIAYLPENQIEDELRRRVDLPNELRFFGNELIDSFGYVADYDDFSVVVFRGSDSLADWLGNIQVVKKKFAWAPGQIHSGFGTALEMTWLSLQHALQPVINSAVTGKRSIWVTGHSLGGALAVCCAAHMKTSGIPVGGICTFGQPMTGNASFTGLLRRMEYWRVVNDRDVAALFPVQFAAGQYEHVGRFFWLRGSGNVRVNAAAESIYKAQTRVNRESIVKLEEHITDHRIENYCDELELLADIEREAK